MEVKRIVYVGELDRTRNSPDHRGIRQGLESFEGLVVDPLMNSQEQCLEMVKEFKPDLIIHGNTDSLGMEMGRIMRPYTKYQVFWMLDYQPNIDNYCWGGWSVEGYDLVLLSNRDQMSEWARRFGCPCEYLPHGCVVQDLARDERFYHKVLFIGSLTDGGWYSDRYNLLMGLQPFDHITAGEADQRDEIWKNMPALYHTSDCVLDISHSWSADGYASGRYFYTGGLGACSITKYFPGCEELYPKGTKAYFNTVEEARRLIEFYTTHEKEREEMKVRAWEHNKKHHTYKQRFDEIIRLCESI